MDKTEIKIDYFSATFPLSCDEEEKLIVEQGYFVRLKSFIEKIDLLSSFADGINQSSN